MNSYRNVNYQDRCNATGEVREYYFIKTIDKYAKFAI